MISQKIAVVIGGSKGIGAAVALELADRGMHVVLTYASDATGAEAVVEAIKKSSRTACALQLDLKKHDQIDRFFEHVSSQFGKIDTLVNNAGISGAAPLSDISWEFLTDVIDVNLNAVIMCSARALPLFQPVGGTIVNISSAMANQPFAGQAAYAASKAGIEAVTRVLAYELGGQKIRVNAVAPGPTDTRLIPNDPNVRAYIESRTVLGRIGSPSEIAKVVGFLASDDAGWIT